ncbi:hypothetical protein NIE88_11865 [Sporolactobacillus shoreicorticis]|uniref:5-bromo-4-chloroindolyl phosphate hydrolysis protein n=1 Tax=Sporolactobacillus shoreicorticis TaxID=1923877 RepID=A0ABW5S1K6_9BACL|nr:hypothetical protein [Sporolactobacillus shoreicorticis]MCO7126464.1 hypothetical protein [Sporolactobacillus shoreicorticis]
MNRLFKFIGLLAGVVIIDIFILSPQFLGIAIGGESAFQTALGVTLLFASAMAILVALYLIYFKPRSAGNIPQLETREDYLDSLREFKDSQVFGRDIDTVLAQVERLEKKKDTVKRTLAHRFGEGELSYQKFMAPVSDVEKLFYVNIRNIIVKVSVFDEGEYFKLARIEKDFTADVMEDKMQLFNHYIDSVKSSKNINEEVLTSLDKLILEISNLNTVDVSEVDNLPCMQEMNQLISQTKYYKNSEGVYE